MFASRHIFGGASVWTARISSMRGLSGIATWRPPSTTRKVVSPSALLDLADELEAKAVTDRAPAAYDPKRRNGELISDGQAPRELYRDRGLPQIRRSTRRWTTRAQDEIYRSTRVIAITATSVRIPAKVRASVSRVNGLPHTRPAGWAYT
jgi:hypothetical protein